MSDCIITGCTFVDSDNLRAIRGDLHQLMDILIFNASGCEWFDVSEAKPLKESDMMVRASRFYEKNSVIVFPLMIAQFNDVAHEYLVKSIRDEQSQIITFGNGRLQ